MRHRPRLIPLPARNGTNLFQIAAPEPEEDIFRRNLWRTATRGSGASRLAPGTDKV